MSEYIVIDLDFDVDYYYYYCYKVDVKQLNKYDEPTNYMLHVENLCSKRVSECSNFSNEATISKIQTVDTTDELGCNIKLLIICTSW